MAAPIQPLRRRLTVGAASHDAAEVTEDDDSKDLKSGLNNLAEEAKEKGSKFVALWSVLSKERQRENTMKNTTCISSFDNESDAVAWVEGIGIGFRCMKGKKPDSPNQDNFAFIVAEGDYSLYLVLDGHGPNGHEVSGLVLDQLITHFLGNASRDEESWKKTFSEVQQFVSDKVAHAVDASMSGTTVTLAYHDLKTDILTLAHVGDSRAILAGSGEGVMELTQDHKPNLPEEKLRIESANPPGRVVFDGYFNHRVFAKGAPYPGLNMSRAIGDVLGHRDAGLSAEPDVKTIDLNEQRKEFGGGFRLLLCTDGVWEFIENRDAQKIIYEADEADAQVDMARLAQEAFQRWMKDSDNELADDITGILVELSTKAAGS